ncbi:MAG: hypothetical protein WCD55_11855 [Bacteroidales bacterium]
MKIVKKVARPFLIIAGKSECIINSAVAAKIKHNAEFIFIGSHCGAMLLKIEMLKAQPIRSRVLSRYTTNSDIHIIILNLWGNPGG